MRRGIHKLQLASAAYGGTGEGLRRKNLVKSFRYMYGVIDPPKSKEWMLDVGIGLYRIGTLYKKEK